VVLPNLVRFKIVSVVRIYRGVQSFEKKEPEGREYNKPETAAVQTRRSHLKIGGHLKGWLGRPTMTQANKRIPVTEDRWQELNDLKGAGQTYDALLKELIQEHNRRQLAERVRSIRTADEKELTPLDEL
jgi:hypothetical protein